MTKCPYCGSKIDTSKEGPNLFPREQRVFDILVNAGRSFTKVDDLLGPTGSATTIRVIINSLNKKLKKHKMEIVNNRGTGYRIERS